MSPILDAAVSILLLAGAAFALVGSFGLAKLSDFFLRVHCPTKATTLGVGSVLIASSLWFSLRAPGISLHEILITVFLFVTAPVSAQLLATAALRLRQHTLPPEFRHRDQLHDGEGGDDRDDRPGKHPA